MNKKYELTDEAIEVDGHTLHRIKALKDFGDVKTNDLGGYVESTQNLSTSDKSWIFDTAMVYDHARVNRNSIVHDSAKVYDFAKVTNKASVGCDIELCGHTMICGYRKKTLLSFFKCKDGRIRVSIVLALGSLIWGTMWMFLWYNKPV